MANKRLKIGILGCRGIPNRYGGYEQFAQYLSHGLVKRGHEVFVYNSSLHPYRKKSWNGVHILRKFDPEDRLGTVGQFVYDFNCLIDARKRKFDVLLQLGYTSNAIFYPLWPRKTKNFLHMDGLEWKRTKYNTTVRKFLRKMEKWAALHGDILIADSLSIQKHLRESYQVESEYIPYGAEVGLDPERVALESYNLPAFQYDLAIARFVPENNLETIVKGHLDSGISLPLVLVGKYDTPIGRKLFHSYGSNRKIRFLGGVFDQEKLNALRHYARLYFHGHSVGGTNPSLLEAMACRVTIAAHNNPFNRAILGKEAYYFSNSQDLVKVIQYPNSDLKMAEWKEANYQKIRKEFNWKSVIDLYETLFFKYAVPKRVASVLPWPSGA